MDAARVNSCDRSLSITASTAWRCSRPISTGLPSCVVRTQACFAQHLGRADARAHAAQRVGFEDGARRAAQVAVGDAADEGRHVDAGRAGGDAGRVEAVQAALGFEQRLRASQARAGVGKAQRVVAGAQAARADVGKQGDGHAGNSCDWESGFETDRLVKFEAILASHVPLGT